MALKIFKNKGESGAIPLSAENLNYDFQEVLNLVCPVGKVEIFFDDDDHSNYLGFTWERTSQGKAIVGIDSSDTDFNTIGKTGGEKTHKLTIDEMPNHTHDTIVLNVDPSGYSFANDNNALYVLPNTYSIGAKDAKGWSSALAQKSTGGSQPHNNLQPYQVFAIWKRTA